MCMHTLSSLGSRIFHLYPDKHADAHAQLYAKTVASPHDLVLSLSRSLLHSISIFLSLALTPPPPSLSLSPSLPILSFSPRSHTRSICLLRAAALAPAPTLAPPLALAFS